MPCWPRAKRMSFGLAGILKRLGEDCSKIYLAAAVPNSSLDMSEDAPLLKVGVLHSEGEIPPSRDRHLHRECSTSHPGLLLGGKLVEKELQEGSITAARSEHDNAVCRCAAAVVRCQVDGSPVPADF